MSTSRSDSAILAVPAILQIEVFLNKSTKTTNGNAPNQSKKLERLFIFLFWQKVTV